MIGVGSNVEATHIPPSTNRSLAVEIQNTRMCTLMLFMCFMSCINFCNPCFKANNIKASYVINNVININKLSKQHHLLNYDVILY